MIDYYCTMCLTTTEKLKERKNEANVLFFPHETVLFLSHLRLVCPCDKNVENVGKMSANCLRRKRDSFINENNVTRVGLLVPYPFDCWHGLIRGEMDIRRVFHSFLIAVTVLHNRPRS